MYKYITLFFTIVQAFDKVQYEQGIDDSLHFAQPPLSVLQFGQEIPRCNWNHNSFLKHFPTIPKLALSFTFLDWQHGEGAGFIVEHEDLTKTDFVIKTTALSELQIYGVYVSWFAFYDPMITVQYYETTKMQFTQDLPQNDPYHKRGGNYAHKPLLVATLFIAFVNDYGDDEVEILCIKVPAVVVFLNGFKLHGQASDIMINVEMVKSNGVYLKVRSRAQIRFLRVCMVYGSKDILYRDRESFTAYQNNSFTDVTVKGKKTTKITHKIHNTNFSNLRQGYGLFFGLSGFYTDYMYNSRLYMELHSYSKQLEIILGSFHDTRCFQIKYEFFIYVPDTSQKVFRENCAEIFSQCGFTGSNLQICESVKLSDVGYQSQIKSIFVPKDMVFTVNYEDDGEAKLITRANFKDYAKDTKKSSNFYETIDCIEDVKSQKQVRPHSKKQYMGKRLNDN